MKRLLLTALLVLAGCQDLPTAEPFRPMESPPTTGQRARCRAAVTPPCAPDQVFASYDNRYATRIEIYVAWDDTAFAKPDTLYYEIARNAAGDTETDYVQIARVRGGTAHNDPDSVVWGYYWDPRSASNPDGFNPDSIWHYTFRARVDNPVTAVDETKSDWSGSATVAYGTPDAAIAQVDSVGTTWIAISWNASTNLTGLNDTYEYLALARHGSEDNDRNVTLIECADCTSFRHSGLTPGETWSYRVYLRYGVNGTSFVRDGGVFGTTSSN